MVTPDGRLINLEPSDSEQAIVLEGIIYDEDGYSYAVINGEVLGIGDYVMGQMVFDIEPDRVMLLEDNKPVEYILNEEEALLQGDN